MDRRQILVQRVREYFGDRVDDVLHMVRQDRQDLRGWQEPAHVRSVLRRMMNEGGKPEEGTERTMVAEVELGRGAAEPEPGMQRESTGMLLEAGATALEKVTRNSGDLQAEEMLGLECVLLLYGRPSVFIFDNQLSRVPPFWNILEDQREDIEMAQRGVGRIELLGHPEYDWAGTGFLVSENLLMTSRRTAELFIECRGNTWQFRPGITTWMNYRSAYQCVSNAGYRVRSVVGVHDRYDVALLEVERPQINGTAPAPLALSALPPSSVEGRPVYMIGYPVRDARRNEPENICRIFRDVYNVKRLQPGMLRGCLQFHEVQLLRHDCGSLGQMSGAPLFDLETHQVLGMHSTGRYLEPGTAIPLWVLRDDAMLRSNGVTFAEATTHEKEMVVEQLDRLSRTRFWNEARSVISTLYQRAFGSEMPRMARS